MSESHYHESEGRGTYYDCAYMMRDFVTTGSLKKWLLCQLAQVNIIS